VFRALHEAGATYAEIARECGCDPRTVRKYLAEDAASVPPVAPLRAGTQPRLIEPFIELAESWLRADPFPWRVIHAPCMSCHTRSSGRSWESGLLP
jgi:transposase